MTMIAASLVVVRILARIVTKRMIKRQNAWLQKLARLHGLVHSAIVLRTSETISLCRGVASNRTRGVTKRMTGGPHVGPLNKAASGVAQIRTIPRDIRHVGIA